MRKGRVRKNEGKSGMAEEWTERAGTEEGKTGRGIQKRGVE